MMEENAFIITKELLPMEFSAKQSFRYFVKGIDEICPSYQISKFGLSLERTKAYVTLSVFLFIDNCHKIDIAVLNSVIAQKTFNLSCHYLNDIGQVLETVTIQNAKLTTANYSELNYSSNETAKVELFFEADISCVSFE